MVDLIQNRESGKSVRDKINALLSKTPALATRADLLAQQANFAVGAVVSAGGVSYRYDGTSSLIADLPGWRPEGAATFAHWGADTTATDNGAAVQSALRSGLKIRERGAVYQCAAEITVTDVAVDWRGGTLRFTGATNGITITQAGRQVVDIRDVRIETTQQEPGRAFKVGRSGEAILERNAVYTRVSRCYIGGTDYLANGWTQGIVLDECSQALIEGNVINGRRNEAASGALRWWPGMTEGVLLTSTADKNPVDQVLAHNYIRYAAYGIRGTGKQEGSQIQHNNVVACGYGFHEDRTELVGAPTANPWSHVVDNHFNCASGGVYMRRTTQAFVSRNLIYQFEQVDLPFVGVELHIGNDPSISDNTILGQAASANTTKGVLIDQANRGQVVRNRGINLAQMVEVSDASGGIVDAIIRDNSGTDKAGAKLRQVTYTGTASKTANPSANYFGVIGSGTNASTITLTAGAAVTCATISMDADPVGTRYRVSVNAEALKAGSSFGATKLYLGQFAGTGSIVCGHNATQWTVQNNRHNAGEYWTADMCALVEKTAAGTVQLEVRGFSSVDGATIAAGKFQYVVERIA